MVLRPELGQYYGCWCPGSSPRVTCSHNIDTISKPYSDIIISVVMSQITGISIVCTTICSDSDQRKHQSSASLAFVRGIHRSAVNSPHKGPVAWKMFPFADVIMDKWLLVFHEEGYQLPVPFQCQEMRVNSQIVLCFLWKLFGKSWVKGLVYSQAKFYPKLLRRSRGVCDTGGNRDGLVFGKQKGVITETDTEKDICQLTHWGLVMHTCSDLSNHWFR